MWYKIYSLHLTKDPGRFACHITSKIIGIGSSARTWGDLNHIKTNKGLVYQERKQKKSATIVEASCAAKYELV